jgi:hypothetical protein
MYLHWLQQRGDCTFKIHAAMLSNQDWTLQTVATRGWTFFSFRTQATGCEMWLVTGYTQTLSSTSTQALKSPPFCQLYGTDWVPQPIRYEVLADALMKIQVFWEVMLWRLATTHYLTRCDIPKDLNLWPDYDSRNVLALKKSRLNHGFESLICPVFSLLSTR